MWRSHRQRDLHTNDPAVCVQISICMSTASVIVSYKPGKTWMVKPVGTLSCSWPFTCHIEPALRFQNLQYSHKSSDGESS